MGKVGFGLFSKLKFAHCLRGAFYLTHVMPCLVMIGIQTHKLDLLRVVKGQKHPVRERESVDIANTCPLGFCSMAGITQKSTQIFVTFFWNFKQIFAYSEIDLCY